MRIPRHIGVIPDGNRRWAQKHNLNKEEGYTYGLGPGLELFKLCQKEGVEELTFYGFTMDNTKRPAVQTKAFSKTCVEAVKMISREDASILVVGNTETPMFPKELIPYTKERKKCGTGGLKVNFLINYGWHWDLSNLNQNESRSKKGIISSLKSQNVSRINLIIRWGERRRLSGFLPAQSVYSDFYVVDSYWPDFKKEDFYDALRWYAKQDVTLGG
ncbi:undecaprenyl pyrophosphate synthase [Halobacteroides halobius DSM 5150]|uniref:Undecaprenyl pyrophosphate synthase n=1 Tax=Halobacteroides halobius (strain ATCC 35273 / DSM 5150 / MD-1) TaxID=748449 RepID=L0K9N5_HALHC|nr:undecaprenyl diphosphate synthase family protein [Halobacteroides halobius]AGB41250.1 undecaprenyl pyrophosphate synthase [Halobacteroides halobius DSM 5150]